MAFSDYVVTTGSVTLTASATKSLWLLNPATNNATIFGIDVSMNASTVVAGVQFDLYIVTSLGSPAGTSATVNKMNALNTVAATTTGLTALSAEPTTVAVLASWYLQPVGGDQIVQLPLAREYQMAGAGARWGLRYTTASGVTPGTISNVYFEE